MDRKFDFKKMLLLVSPLLAFAVLLVPYSWANQAFIVDWLGCGCNPGFNANDFTRLFWFVASFVTSLLSFICSKKHLNKIWMRGIYALCVFALTLALSIPFCQSMMWK